MARFLKKVHEAGATVTGTQFPERPQVLQSGFENYDRSLYTRDQIGLIEWQDKTFDWYKKLGATIILHPIDNLKAVRKTDETDLVQPEIEWQDPDFRYNPGDVDG